MLVWNYGDRKNRGKLFMNKLWKRVLKGLLLRVLTGSLNYFFSVKQLTWNHNQQGVMNNLVNWWKSRFFGAQKLGVDGKQLLLDRMAARMRCTSPGLFHTSWHCRGKIVFRMSFPSPAVEKREKQASKQRIRMLSKCELRCITTKLSFSKGFEKILIHESTMIVIVVLFINNSYY